MVEYEPPPPVEYEVLLVFPGFGEERENAEQIVEAALQHLNTEKEEPGMRFAPNVSARLEIVAGVEDAHDKLETDEDLAMMILHDLDEDEKTQLTQECAERGVLVCHTLPCEDRPRRTQRGERRPWKIVFSKRKPGELRAHKISEATLTASLEGDEEEVMDRVGQLIAVMALGVMEHHWSQNPPRRYWEEDLPEA
jgi:hypothetical protein